jgi:hypothetical protein
MITPAMTKQAKTARVIDFMVFSPSMAPAVDLDAGKAVGKVICVKLESGMRNLESDRRTKITKHDFW